MKLYNCRVQVGGDVGGHEVPKSRITEKELRLLKHMHGNDAIKALEPAGDIVRDDMDEYRRLATIYNPLRVSKFFGIDLENFDDWLNEKIAAGEVENRHADTMRELREIPVPNAAAVAVAPGSAPQPAGSLE